MSQVNHSLIQKARPDPTSSFRGNLGPNPDCELPQNRRRRTDTWLIGDQVRWLLPPGTAADPSLGRLSRTTAPAHQLRPPQGRRLDPKYGHLRPTQLQEPGSRARQTRTQLRDAHARNRRPPSTQSRSRRANPPCTPGRIPRPLLGGARFRP